MAIDERVTWVTGVTLTTYLYSVEMSSNATETETLPVAKPKQKKLKPARKQVKPGDVERKETPQTGKEYSTFSLCTYLNTANHSADIWYNKWAGGDREDSYSK